MLLLHFERAFVYSMILLCTIYAVDSISESSRYERLNRRLLPYEEHEFSLSGPLRRAPKRGMKLRTAGGFGKRDDLRSSVGGGKRDEFKIKKLQRGSLRTAIGWGKRSLMYRTPESDPSLQQRIPQKENYPADWYYEEATENDQDPFVKIMRKFQEVKRNRNEETNDASVDESEQPYLYNNRFTSSSSNLDDEQ